MATFSKWLTKRFKDRSNDEDVIFTIKKQNLQNAVENNKSKNTLLHYAAKWNNKAITQYLIDSGSRVDAQNRLGKTPLIVAIEMGGCKDTIEILIEAGASIFIRDKCGASALKIFGSSRSWDDSDVGEVLLRNYDFPNDNEKILDMLRHHHWYLYKIVALRNADITKLMLESQYSDSIIAKPYGVRSALIIATKSADVDNVKLLLDYCNTNVKVKNKVYLNCLSYAFFGDTTKHSDERVEILKMLLERVDSLINNEGQIEKNVAYYLLKRGNKEAIELLLQNGLHLSAVDSSGNSVVHLLVRNENPGVIELLRGKNFNVNARNYCEETPLMIAASSGIPHAVEFLLEVGADVNAMDCEDLTSLSQAILNCTESKELQYRDCVQILLEHGAGDEFVNDHDETTISYFLLEDGHNLVNDIVISHLALQEALGTSIKQSCRDEIDSDEKSKDNFESSQRELEAKVYKSITLLELLTINKRTLERYARNQEIYSKLQDYTRKKCKFDYFKSLLKKRISKAIQTVELRKEVNCLHYLSNDKNRLRKISCYR